jgi:cytochrome c
MRSFGQTLFVSALFSMSASFAHAEAPATKKDAIDLVNKAHAFLVANGKAKMLETINTPNNQFQRGELYVLAYNTKGIMVGHPFNPKLINRDLTEVPDPDGKYFRKEIAEVARTQKTGWVDYKYKNPASGKVEAKTTYVMAAGDIILAAGIYK